MKEMRREDKSILYIGLLSCPYIVFLGERAYIAHERLSLSPKYDPIVMTHRALPVPTGG